MLKRIKPNELNVQGAEDACTNQCHKIKAKAFTITEDLVHVVLQWTMFGKMHENVRKYTTPTYLRTNETI